MKHFISILSVFILLASCKNTPEVDLTGLSAKSQIQNGSVHKDFINLPRITDADREVLQLNKIKIDGQSLSEVSNNDLAKGEVIFKSETCRLETFFWFPPNGAIAEILVTYDAQGDKVDSLPIGLLSGGTDGIRVFSTLVGSEITGSGADFNSGEVGRIETYELGKDLKFKKTKTWNHK